MIEELNTETSKIGLKINFVKTKIMSNQMERSQLYKRK